MCYSANLLPSSNTSCPNLFGFDLATNSCRLRCPFPPYEQAHYWRKHDITNWVITPLSLIVEIAFLIPWAYHGVKQRNLHTRYPFFYLVCMLLYNVNQAMMWGGSAKWVCKDEFTGGTYARIHT